MTTPDRNGGPGHSLADALKRLAGAARQRSLIVVVSDFRGPRDWRRPLLQLAGRHEVVAVEVRDPREQELAPAGTLWLVDPESGDQLQVDTNDGKLRARFAAAAADERAAVSREFAGAGVAHATLSTDRDWLRDLADLRATEAPVSFSAPTSLLWLLAIPILIGLYVYAGRRRRRAAARFANPALVPNLVPHSPGWRRHVPSALVLASLAVLVVGIARPHVVRDVTRNEATIILAIDTSRSMAATDVEPSRFAAARAEAEAFLETVPEEYAVGIVSFATSADPVLPADARSGGRARRAPRAPARIGHGPRHRRHARRRHRARTA